MIADRAGEQPAADRRVDGIGDSPASSTAAFQTGILALTAPVEAARAGEQGRGFAVEQGAAAAESLKQQAGMLVEVVGVFRIGA